ncbi:MAG: PHP domain-containing protein [Dehalogenimonas sp.]|uniref:PHP domain-containing protein n=1 Tax=Candidatus Dehalogenimonas loeffleri TaxID=3127115 RepID=A0ABZ2J7M2_9CHLR|nr:PHP domain-containing protein [Dehalogenimonas sp.]
MIKVDLHIHTFYSPDANTTFEELTDRCRVLGLGAIAIADHGTVEGALDYIKTGPPVKVIVAEEILTPHGEIMGMFLKETIPSGFSVDETIKAIREQDGLVCIPHPFDPVRSSALDSRVLEQLAEAHKVDILETVNARYVFNSSIRQARKFAESQRLLPGAGSDAHSAEEIGSVYLEMADFNNKAQFLEALRKARIYGRNRSPFVHVSSIARKIKKNITGR